MKRAPLHYEEMETQLVPCAVCGATEFETLAKTDRYRMGLRTVGCRACGLMFTNPQPTAESVARFYTDDYRRFYQSVDAPTSEYVAAFGKDVRAMAVSEHILSKLAHSTLDRIADLGCAEGSLLGALGSRLGAARLFGLEVNAAFAQFARKSTGATIVTSIEQLPQRCFDLVVINHVLEHVLDPIAYLRDAGNLLGRTGRLYVAVPDASAYGSVRDLHIAHLYHFTSISLSRCLERARLAVISAEVTHPPHHPTSLTVIARASDTAIAYETSFDSTGWRAVRNANRYAPFYHVRRAIALQRARLKATFAR